jgi:hypothetical protein
MKTSYNIKQEILELAERKQFDKYFISEAIKLLIVSMRLANVHTFNERDIEAAISVIRSNSKLSTQAINAEIDRLKSLIPEILQEEREEKRLKKIRLKNRSEEERRQEEYAALTPQQRVDSINKKYGTTKEQWAEIVAKNIQFPDAKS